MKKAARTRKKTKNYRALDADALVALLEKKDSLLKEKESLLEEKDSQLSSSKQRAKEQKNYIVILEECLRLATIRKFCASSEKLDFQMGLFDEAELEVALAELDVQLPEEKSVTKPTNKQRRRGFSKDLNRIRIELKLSEAEKAGAKSTFFAKVKEELEFIPAKLNVLEYWQEKAVFPQDNGADKVVTAARPSHPLGKCTASTSLLAHIITAKYADGLPLYRQEGILKRYGGEVSRSCMAHWIVRLEDVFKPLLSLVREVQNESDYLQADETRMPVLKEPGKTVQSQKWMWVIRGGPPDKPSVLFYYDPSRGGSVPVRLLDGFNGVLQADGYSGYSVVCAQNNITRIGCMDHARRKFVEAVKASQPAGTKKHRSQLTKAEIALDKIRKLYRIEKVLKNISDEQRYAGRQKLALPVLKELKTWLDDNIQKVFKGGHTHKAMQYMLNQWEYLIGYCEDGRLQISNVLAENAIRPLAVGRKAWLFADTSKGACASAACYSLIETAKANSLEPYAYIKYVLDHIGEADTLDKLEALLPWNVPMEKFEKNVAVFNGGKMSI